jgi:hypothetical protein
VQAESRRATDQAVDNSRHHLSLDGSERYPTTHVYVLKKPTHPIGEPKVCELNARDPGDGSETLHHESFQEAREATLNPRRIEAPGVHGFHLHPCT